MGKDYYNILGVSKNATKDEIKKAFRKLAHQYHPDKGTGNEDKFKEVNEAYSVLSDDSKRAQYDQFGSAAFNSGGAGGYYNGQGFGDFGGFDFSNFGGFQNGGVEFDLGDIFGGIFGGGGGKKKTRKGADIAVDTEITFKESVFGVDKKIFVTKTSLCDHCKGTRAEPGTELTQCPTCSGKGQVQETRRSIFGNFSSTRTCTECEGTGKIPKEKCSVCRGAGVIQKKEEYVVVIPPGINDGEMLRLSQAGEAIVGGTPGDLYIRVHVQKDPIFAKEGANIIMHLSLKLSEAILGGDRIIQTLDGDITIAVPAGITHGEILRVRGKGVPADQRKNSQKRGDLLIHISIDIPKKLSKRAKQLIDELKSEGL